MYACYWITSADYWDNENEFKDNFKMHYTCILRSGLTQITVW